MFNLCLICQSLEEFSLLWMFGLLETSRRLAPERMGDLHFISCKQKYGTVIMHSECLMLSKKFFLPAMSVLRFVESMIEVAHC